MCALADIRLDYCKSNRSLCGETEEVHCITNGTDSFCSCKAGFENNGFGNCQGVLISASTHTHCSTVDLVKEQDRGHG